MGKLIIGAGLVLIVIGLLYTYVPQAINWFGHLPGDIRVENTNSQFYFPITSMIVISVFIHLLLRVMRYFS
jgi:thiosulfate reductase cytochrome b subunit